MSSDERVELAVAEAVAAEFCCEAAAASGRGVEFVVCGSVRRREATVGDLDVVALADDPAAVREPAGFARERGGVMARFGRFGNPEVKVNIFVGTLGERGAMMLFATGCAAFNVQMRVKARMRGMKLNRHGLWRGDGGLMHAASEDGIFDALGWRYAPPDMRTARPSDTPPKRFISKTRPGVIYLANQWDCTCPGFKWHGTCWHVRAAKD